MSRPPSRASVRSTTSTGSKTAPKKPAPASRPTTPDVQGSLQVEMGDVAWLASNGSASTLFQSEDIAKDKKKREEINTGDFAGLFTRGMATCFTVVVVAREGAIMAHVSGYLGHDPIHPDRVPELKAIKDAFARVWTKRRFDAKTSRVVIVRGPYTKEAERQKLMAHIFPQLAKITPILADCTKSPLEPNKYHGTALVKIGPSGMEFFAEDNRLM